jgi:hypothetical protein
MDTQNKNWKILSWNVHGMNDNRKWAAIINIIEESVCIAFCLQETKKSIIDSAFLKNTCSRRFNKFEFLPSDGASGGLLTVWNGNQFYRELVDSNSLAITVKLTYLQSHQQWFLSNVYGPCTPNGRADFTNWLYNLDASAYELWLLLGDLNLIRHPENRNRLGRNINDMMFFNDIISHLDLIEIPLKIGLLHGVICNKMLCWVNWIGYSLAPVGQILFLTPWLLLCHMLSLIMFHMSHRWNHQCQNLMSSDLITTRSLSLISYLQ